MNYRKLLLGLISTVAVACVNETNHYLSIPEYARNIKNTHVCMDYSNTDNLIIGYQFHDHEK